MSAVRAIASAAISAALAMILEASGFVVAVVAGIAGLAFFIGEQLVSKKSKKPADDEPKPLGDGFVGIHIVPGAKGTITHGNKIRGYERGIVDEGDGSTHDDNDIER